MRERSDDRAASDAMASEFRPVPAHSEDLLHAARAGGFGFSASRHRTPIATHAHEHATITFLLRGAFEEAYPGHTRRQVCAASSVLFRPAGEPHADQMGREGADNLVIEVEPARLDVIRGYTSVLDGISHARDARLDGIGQRIAQELTSGDTASALALEGLALELIALASRAEGRSPDARLRPAWVVRARDLLHARFAEADLRIAELAAEAGVHPVYFARAFRAHYGVTPGEYVRQLRLQWSARALSTSGQSLSTIALAAGFADQSHFTRAFRRAFGVTPGRYRREGER
jgi:AraC family transcriptional regulator